MDLNNSFPCPNCGSHALRRHFVGQEAIYNSCRDRQVMTTECPACDYLMTICSLDGKVIESSSSQFTTRLPNKPLLKAEIRLIRRTITA